MRAKIIFHIKVAKDGKREIFQPLFSKIFNVSKYINNNNICRKFSWMKIIICFILLFGVLCSKYTENMLNIKEKLRHKKNLFFSSKTNNKKEAKERREEEKLSIKWKYKMKYKKHHIKHKNHMIFTNISYYIYIVV